ncbi:prepilin-type N-terminal cleavage/methylation domain-containing protein [Psychrobacter fulvigenes]|uniref:prepilin-type N-terminal cleavage/methylation domain-containing protein n=1 Tax=Psychrobacter fulvigenes TaxID=533323 RepID=UPI001918096E|nr:prepilin-type N-terminal cleavage/methylation domain-containing protein [Psychrobacter fulvigenes]
MKTSIRHHCDKTQKGFTLIELMISLFLGLLVSAAAIQVYIINAKTAGIQSSASELVEDAAFNLPIIERRARLANLGLADNVAANEPGSGIVLTSANNALEDEDGNKELDNFRNPKVLAGDPKLPKDITLGGSPIEVALLTRTGDQDGGTQANEWTGASNVSSKSGQLTIQYRAPQDMYDCEGKLALGPRQVTIGGVKEIIDGQVIVERFYLRAPDASKPTELSLYCDAGKYITEIMDDYAEQSKPEEKLPKSVEFTTNSEVRDFGDAGQEIMTNVDYFDILLSTRDSDLLQYYTVKDYLDLDIEDQPPIVGIKYGLILRSDNAVLTEEGPSEFTVLGKSSTINNGLSKKYLRTVVESYVTLRNIVDE